MVATTFPYFHGCLVLMGERSDSVGGTAGLVTLLSARPASWQQSDGWMFPGPTGMLGAGWQGRSWVLGMPSAMSAPDRPRPAKCHLSLNSDSVNIHMGQGLFISVCIFNQVFAVFGKMGTLSCSGCLVPIG